MGDLGGSAGGSSGGTATAVSFCNGRYRKLRDIGHGAQRGQGHHVRGAGKRNFVTADPTEAAKAEKEVEILQALREHPHIIRYYHSFDEWEGVSGEQRVAHIVMEYCQKGDLSEFLKERTGPRLRHLPGSLISRWAEQLLLGVGYLHDHGYLHRDLKPANVFITAGDELKLADFGISRTLGMCEMAQTMVGTPYYMAPEVMGVSAEGRSHDGYNSKSDVWSLGCIIYQLCALRVPFPGANVIALLAPPADGAHRADAPPALPLPPAGIGRRAAPPQRAAPQRRDAANAPG
eukprot:gene48256-14773_t